MLNPTIDLLQGTWRLEFCLLILHCPKIWYSEAEPRIEQKYPPPSCCSFFFEGLERRQYEVEHPAYMMLPTLHHLPNNQMTPKTMIQQTCQIHQSDHAQNWVTLTGAKMVAERFSCSCKRLIFKGRLFWREASVLFLSKAFEIDL